MSSSADRRRILVVDDNEDAADTLADLLVAPGAHPARRARRTVLRIRLLDEFTPEVALIDLGLPVMDGYELAAFSGRTRRSAT